MSMKKTWILPILLAFALQVSAQQKKAPGKWYLIPEAALLSGENATSSQLSIKGGIRKKDWNIGLGVALDKYEFRSIPVFIDTRKSITRWRHPLIAYLNTGINLPYIKDPQYRYDYFYVGNFIPQGLDMKSHFDRGLYGEMGLGYALYNKKKRGLVVSAGYSVKTLTEKYTQLISAYNPPYSMIQVERRLDYRFNRFLVKLGYRLW